MKPEPEQDCMECLTDELKPENVAPVHDESRLFVDSQVGKGVYGGAKKNTGSLAKRAGYFTNYCSDAFKCVCVVGSLTHFSSMFPK